MNGQFKTIYIFLLFLFAPFRCSYTVYLNWLLHHYVFPFEFLAETSITPNAEYHMITCINYNFNNMQVVLEFVSTSSRSRSVGV